MPHTPQNVNALHKAEQDIASLSQKLAILLTRAVGTMACAYFFLILALLGLPALFPPVVSQWVQWVSQTLIQLVMLSVIMVGQGILGRHQELQADEQYNTTTKTYHDTEQIMQHLEAQDEKILLILTKLEQRG